MGLVFTSLVGAVLLLAAYGVVSIVSQDLRLRHIKGPFSARLSKWWLIGAIGSKRTHLDLYEVCQKYGPIARIGPNYLVTTEPDLLRRMLNVRTTYKRSDWYVGMRFDPTKDNVLSTRNDELHNALRSKMAAGYSGKEVENLETKIDENIRALVNLLDTKYVSVNKPFDLGRKAQYFTLDVISDLAFGQPFGDIATDSDVYEYIGTMEENLPNIIMATVLPWLMDVLSSPLFKSLLPSEKDAIGLGKTIGIAKKVAAERYGPNKDVQKDMLGSFVAHGLSQTEAGSEILVQILAGSDTTATAIRATMLHIITNARVVNALLAEIRESRPSQPITDAEARAMPYLQAVIKEGLRIFPPVTGLMTKDVPDGGDTYNGVFFPDGTKIAVCMWGVFRRTDVWGEDVHEFRPERWLDSSPEKLREMEATMELAFGYGRWQCLGRNVALMELNKVFVELLRRFDFVILDPTTPWESKNYGIFMQSNFWMKAYRRDNSV